MKLLRNVIPNVAGESLNMRRAIGHIAQAQAARRTRPSIIKERELVTIPEGSPAPATSTKAGVLDQCAQPDTPSSIRSFRRSAWTSHPLPS